MIFSQAMREKMQAAARTLMSNGAGSATAAIQAALNDLPSGATIFDALQGGGAPDSSGRFGERFRGGQNVPAFVKDLLGQLGVPGGGQGWEARRQTQTAKAAHAEEAPVGNRGQFLQKSFTNSAGTRSYKLYIPASYRGQSMPVMVMLHGCAQNPDDFAAGTRMNDVAESAQCFVVYPAQAQGANSSKCWNWFNAIDQQRGQGEPSIIAGITSEVVDAYKLDADRVFVAGLSSGGAMAVIMATTYPELYAAVGVHSGLPYASAHDLPSAFAAMRGTVLDKPASNYKKAGAIPIIIFHGDSDTTVNACNGAQLMQQSANESATEESGVYKSVAPNVVVEQGQVPNGHRYTCTSHQNAEGHTLAEHWVVHEAGHAWSGGSPAGSYTDGRGPDASQEMLRFFLLQSKSPN